MPSKEQRDFTGQMDALLSKGLPFFGMEDNSQLGDWVVILSAPYINDEGDLTSGYSMCFSSNMLQHNALGLLSKAAELLDSGNEVDLDE